MKTSTSIKASAGGIFKAFQFGANVDHSMEQTLQEFKYVANKGKHSQDYKESTRKKLRIETDGKKDIVVFYRCMAIGSLKMCGRVNTVSASEFYSKIYFDPKTVCIDATVEDVYSDVENVIVRNEATKDDLSIQTCLNNGNFNLY